MVDNPKVFEQFFERLKRRRLLKRTFGVFKWLLFTVIFLLLFSYILLQFPAVQNYLVNKVTSYLSEELQTNVSVKKIDIEFFDKLVLEEFYLEDLKGDTLLYSKELKADFKTNLIELFSKELMVDNIYLSDAQINIERDSAISYNNLQFIIDYFKSDKKKKKKKSSSSSKPFLLDVNGIYLNNVQFNQDDNVKGQIFSVHVPKGEILMEKLDLPNKRIEIKNVILNSPHVVVTEKQKFPVPPKPEPAIASVPSEENPAVPPVEEEPVDSTNLPKVYVTTVGHFEMINGTFDYDQLRKSPVRTTPLDKLDFKHLNVFDININIDSFQYTEDVFTGKINQIALEEKSGFVLNKLSANDAMISDRILQLHDMKLITPYSNLGDTLVMKYKTYKDFKDFNDKVKMTGKFNNAEVAIRDIIVFAPKLERNKFFKQNEKEVVKIDGLISGSVNKLRGKDLSLKIGRNTIIQGNFNTRDLSVKGEEFLSLKLDRFKSNIRTLRLLVPGFNAPDNFDKLGILDFSGRFDGFFNDFVAFGKLSTDLGEAEMDMHMNLKKGRALADYEGKLSLNNFDLKSWSGNDNFGKISFTSEVKEGIGLTLETVNATVTGKVQEFTFKDYTYNDIVLDGALKKNLFDGKLVSKDENVDFIFNGKIDFVDSIPSFDFDASINRFDLQALNLSKKPLSIAGDVALDFTNFNLSDINGNGAFYNIEIINEQDTFNIDTLVTSSEIDLNQNRIFKLDSDVVKLNIDGVFDIQEVPILFGQYLVKNFPEFSERFNIKAKDKPVKQSLFDFELLIPNSKNFTFLLDSKLDTIRYAFAKGRMDNINDSVKINVEIPGLKYGNVKFDDILFVYEGYKDQSSVLLDVYHTSINDNQHFEPLKLEGFLERDTFHYELNSTNFTSIFDDLNLNGKLFLVEDYFQVQFLPSNLVILKDIWDIQKDNYIRFGKGFVRNE